MLSFLLRGAARAGVLPCGLGVRGFFLFFLFLFLLFLLFSLFLLFFLFFFLLFLLGLAVNFEDVRDGWSWRGLSSLLIWIMIDPTEPCAPFANVLDHNEIVAISVRPLHPVLEARVLELKDVVYLDLIHPLLVAHHHLPDVCLQEKFLVDDLAAFWFGEARWMDDVAGGHVAVCDRVLAAWLAGRADQLYLPKERHVVLH